MQKRTGDWYSHFCSSVARALPAPHQISKEDAAHWVADRPSLRRLLAPLHKVFLRRRHVQIQTPDDYKPFEVVDPFVATIRRRKIKRSPLFKIIDERICDADYGKPSTVIRPGDRFCVDLVEVLRDVPPKAVLKYLRDNDYVLTGAPGLVLVWQQQRNAFPRAKWTVSFDVKDRLLRVGKRDALLPHIHRRTDGQWHLDVGRFNADWSVGTVLACFKYA